jgi:acetyl esterase/lipase
MTAAIAFSQQEMPLYDGQIPNSRPSANEETTEINDDSILITRKVSQPTIAYYPAAGPNRTAVIICPGGGYGILAADHEGAQVAKKFNEMGVTAFVLKYRIPDDRTMENREIGPLQDAQRAIQFVRSNADSFKINPRRIGIMGFSAGGHLASTAGTHFKKAYISNPDGISLRPDFMILVYPVISFKDSVGHMGSREQLIGKTPSPEKIREYSNELNVTKETPPTFLVHAKDDFVKVANTTLFAAALKKNKVPFETLIYEAGGHGYGMYNPKSPILWMDRVKRWFNKNKWIE